MELPGSVSIKWNLHSLACRQMLTRLPMLGGVSLRGYSRCLDKFNKCLKLTIDDREAEEPFPPNMDEAVRRFGTLLEEFARTEREATVKEVLEEVKSAVIGQANRWSYNQDLQRYCELARQLAISFYETSPNHDCRQLVTIRCLLIPRYYSEADRLSPMAFLREYREDRFTPAVSNAIFVRFNESHDFDNYLAYPGLFFHEYTAHIYATDNGCNRAFNDAWMLWAANEFLQNQIGGLSQIGLHSAQILLRA